MAAANEIETSRRLITLLEEENALLKKRLATEIEVSKVLNQLAESRRLEAEALRKAAEAKDDAIAALKQQTETQEKIIAELKRRRSSPLRRIGDVLIGIAAGMILR
jgi:hypothetical protein